LLRNIYKQEIILYFMKSEKRVLLVLIVFIVIVISVIGVSASWWSTITGNAAKNTKVNVTVKASSNPPGVVYVNNISIINQATLANKDLNNGPASTSFLFNFWGYYDGGAMFMPGVSAGDDVSTYVDGNFSLGVKVRDIMKCNYRGVVANYDGLGLGHDAKNYTCNVTMWYYDDPTPNNWIMRVQVQTLPSGNSLWSPVNGTQTFRLNKLSYWDTDITSVNWTTNQITSNTPSPVLADNNISILNYGNVPIAYSSGSPPYNRLTLNATALTGETTPAQTFGASNFTAKQADLTPCSETGFTDSQWFLLTFTVNPGSGASTFLGFCAKTATNVLPQSYSSQTKPWQINLDYAP
jgi:hypothetical protein